MIAPSDWKCCHSTRYPRRLNRSPAMNSGRLARRGEIAPTRRTAGAAADTPGPRGTSSAVSTSAAAAAAMERLRPSDIRFPPAMTARTATRRWPTRGTLFRDTPRSPALRPAEHLRGRQECDLVVQGEHRPPADPVSERSEVRARRAGRVDVEVLLRPLVEHVRLAVRRLDDDQAVGAGIAAVRE